MSSWKSHWPPSWRSTSSHTKAELDDDAKIPTLRDMYVIPIWGFTYMHPFLYFTMNTVRSGGAVRIAEQTVSPNVDIRCCRLTQKASWERRGGQAAVTRATPRKEDDQRVPCVVATAYAMQQG